jgi:uncharacterized protein YcbX
MRLASIHTYPVKGARGVTRDRAEVRPWGLAGDRRWMLIDTDGTGLTQREMPALATLEATTAPGRLTLRVAGRGGPSLAEPTDATPIPVRVFRNRIPVPALPAGAEADEWLTALFGRPVRLVWLGRPARHLAAGDRPYDTGDQVSFADEYPLLLANRASLDTLNGWLAQEGAVAVPMTRFRPNLVVDAALPWIEEEWAGRRLRIGEVEFRAAGACGRCVVTTVDQANGVRGREPLRTLVRRHTVDGKPRFGLHLVPLGPGTIAAGDPVEPLD